MLFFVDRVGGGWRTRMGHPALALHGAHSDERGLLLVGEMGTLLSSPDGERWRLHFTETEASMRAVARSVEGQTVVLSGDELRSSEDLRSWQSERPEGSGNLVAIVALPRGGFAVATEDGGLLLGRPGSWQAARLPGRAPPSLRALWVGPDGRLWAAGEKGKCFESSDGGKSFKSASLGTSAELRSIHGDEAGRVAVGGSRGLVLTLRGGEWTKAKPPWTAAVGVNVHYLPDGRLLALPGEADASGLYPAVSTDNGDSWQRFEEGSHSRESHAINREQRTWFIHGDQAGRGVQVLHSDGSLREAWSSRNAEVQQAWQREDGAMVAFSGDLFFRSEDGLAFDLVPMVMAEQAVFEASLRRIVVLDRLGNMHMSSDTGKSWSKERIPEIKETWRARHVPTLLLKDGQIWLAGPDLLRFRKASGEWLTLPLPCQHATALAQGPDGTVYLHGGASQNIFDEQQCWSAHPEERAFSRLSLDGVERIRPTPLPGGGAVLHCWRDGQRCQWSWQREAWEPLPIRVHPVNRELVRLRPISDSEWVLLTYDAQVPWTRDGGVTWERAERSTNRAHWSCALPHVWSLCRLRDGSLMGAVSEEHERVFRIVGKAIF